MRARRAFSLVLLAVLALVNEGQDVRARNRDRMNITGTHYEDLEKTFSDDEWMS